jgi:hypothetical protein
MTARIAAVEDVVVSLKNVLVLIDDIAAWGEATFQSPESQADLTRCEEQLGHALPASLRTLLGESDGIVGEFGLGLVWPAARIAQDNQLFRTDPDFRGLFMSFDDLVFFADAGNGDQFAVSLRGPQDVFVWNHEDDTRLWVASDPADYLRRWMTGELHV